MRKWIWGILIVVSLGLVAASWAQWIPLGLTEVFGFITGAVCVMLVIEENIWNFPVGIANNVFFILLFLSARLYGDMGLQLVYIGLAIHGWYQWVCGGANQTVLQISATSWREGAVLIGLGGVLTTALTGYFLSINDAAPFLDALTTVLSLIAQYLLNRKRIENWYVWICADVIYVGLYLSKGLVLTAVLYAVFIAMCVAGLRAWRASLRGQAVEAAVPAVS